MAIRFLTSQNIQAGTLTVSTIANLSTASNVFLVSDSGLVKYRTATQVRSDIGAGTVTSITITPGTGISGGGTITSSGTLTITNTDLGSSQAIFKNIAAAGESTIVADSNNDTLTFVNGSNIAITTNATTDTITISASDTNNYPTTLTWDTGTGILGLGRSGLSTLTVDLDGRYPENNGTGASGTWGINITGNATYATNAGNADTIDNWAFTNTGSNSSTAPDTINSNGISYTAVALLGQSDGALYSQAYSVSWQHQIFGDYRTGQIAIRGKNSGVWQAWRTVLDSSNYTSYAPTLTGGGASGTWNINITGAAASAAFANYADDAGYATNANYATNSGNATISLYVSSPDGDRVASNKLPNGNPPRAVQYDFASASSVTGATGNYAGVMTYRPWDGTSISTGDSSYQLAFANQSGVNASGPAQLLLRNGINATWNAWQTMLSSSNYNNYSPTLTGGAASGTWSISITGSATSTPYADYADTAGYALDAGNATTANTLSSGQSNWLGTGVINNVVGMLAWKNYGNGHVIFDASNSTTPSGGACNNTNPQNNWTGTFPTLMGWNGVNTYGVRVDSTRVADGLTSMNISQFTNNSGYTTGTGTINYVSKFTGTTTFGNSLIYDDGILVTINGALTVTGSPTNLQYTRVNNDLDIFSGDIDSENYGATARLRLSRASGTLVSPTTPSSGTAIGRVEFGAYNSGTASFIMTAKVEATMDATSGANDLPSRLGFFTTPDNTSTMVERMRINNAGQIRIGGTTMNFSDILNIQAGSIAFQNGYGLRFTSTSGSIYASVYSSSDNTVIKSLGTGVLIKNLSGSDLVTVLNSGSVRFNSYGIGTYVGTATQKLAVDSSGNIIEIPIGAGAVDGSGTANYITKWTSTTSLTNSAIFDNGTNVLIGTTDVGTPTFGSAPQFVVANAAGGVIDIRSLNTNILAGSVLGRLQFTGKDDATVGYTTAAIEAVAVGTAGTGNGGGGKLKFMTAAFGTGSSPLPRMWVNSSGNVTIGTSELNYSKLTVDGDIYATTSVNGYLLYAYGGGYGCAIGSPGILGTDIGLYGTAGDEVIAMLNYSDGYYYYGGTSIRSNGSFVGISALPDYPLHVGSQNGNISIYADYDIVAFSDESVKENIRPIENVIERVQKSRGVLYDRIDSGHKDNIGFIAQELELTFPELVVTNEDGTKAVKYQNAVAVMFEAIKEQQKQIDELKELVNKLIK